MLQETVEEQQRDLRWHRRRQRRMTPRRLLQESDELLFWVEECLVQEHRIVPGWLVARLMVVLRHAHPELPAAAVGRLGSGGERRERERNTTRRGGGVVGKKKKKRAPPGGVPPLFA